MSYQFTDPAPVFFDSLGLEPIAGGSVTFYEKGTTSLKNTWSDEELTILNPNPVDLDASGRTNTQVWLDGDYSIVVRDQFGQVVVPTRDITSGQGASASIPPLVGDGFLTNDGTNMFWQTIREVPDPTGLTNRILSTDGSNLLWIEQPEIPEIPDPEIVVTPNSFRAGVSDNTTKYFTQTGTATSSATGGRESNNSVTFPTPFAATPTFIDCMPTSQSNAGGPMVPEIIAMSATGFTVKWTIAAGAGIDAKINNAVPYMWKAEGTVTVTA